MQFKNKTYPLTVYCCPEKTDTLEGRSGVNNETVLKLDND